jgi:hypothetical protein
LCLLPLSIISSSIIDNINEAEAYHKPTQLQKSSKITAICDPGQSASPSPHPQQLTD